MRVLALALLLAGCAAPKPPVIETVYVVQPPEVLVDEPRRPPPMSPPALAVVRNKDVLVAEAGRYVVWPPAKPHIILELAKLTSDASRAVDTMQHERNPAKRAGDLAVARDRVGALADYLKNKGD